MIEPTRLRSVPSAPAGVDFEEFFQAEHDRLFKALYLLTSSVHEADDLAQEALLRAYERWDQVSVMDSPAGYVYRTALNLYRSRLRKLAVRARHVFGVVAVDDIGGAVAIGHDVREALAAMPPDQREAIVLVEWLGLGSEEAGEVLGIAASSVRGRVHRGRTTLREMLGDADE